MNKKTAVYDLVKAVVTDKRQRGLLPDYAIITDLYQALEEALEALVAEGTLICHPSSVNMIPAYEIPRMPA